LEILYRNKSAADCPNLLKFGKLMHGSAEPALSLEPRKAKLISCYFALFHWIR